MPSRVYFSVPRGHELPRSLLESAAKTVLESEGVNEGELSLTFLPDGPIRALNLRWRGHDWAPDVLSFALHDRGESPVGDIYVGLDQAVRQAREHGVPEREELVRLVIHGTLHVLGYDHPEEAEGRAECELYRKQEALVLRVLGEAASEGAGAESFGGSK